MTLRVELVVHRCSGKFAYDLMVLLVVVELVAKLRFGWPGRIMMEQAPFIRVVGWLIASGEGSCGQLTLVPVTVRRRCRSVCGL